MAGFVLIHGSWHGGWCFDEVATLLRAAGHFVSAPTLPGMGGNEAELRAVTLDGWATFAVAECRKMREMVGEGGKVLLAGHSRGGIVVSAAAEKDPAAMDAIAYICAMMMPDGLSRAAFKAMEEPTPEFDSLASPVFGGAGTVVDAARAGPVFAQLSPPELVEPALGRLVAEPHGPRAEPVRTSPERWGSLPRTYIECTQDRTIPIGSQRKMQALSPGARVITLGADHSPYLSRPVELADALLAAVS